MDVLANRADQRVRPGCSIEWSPTRARARLQEDGLNGSYDRLVHQDRLVAALTGIEECAPAASRAASGIPHDERLAAHFELTHQTIREACLHFCMPTQRIQTRPPRRTSVSRRLAQTGHQADHEVHNACGPSPLPVPPHQIAAAGSVRVGFKTTEFPHDQRAGAIFQVGMAIVNRA